MNTTEDIDKFEERWNSYFDEIARLRLSASGEEYDRLGEIKRELKEITSSIAEEQRE